MPRNSTIGTVYLLHFVSPLAHARHYLGWAIDAAARVDDHLAGNGAAIVRAAVRRGIHIELVRTWEGETRQLERKLKRGGTLARVCPICLPAYNARSAANMRRYRAARRAAQGGAIDLGAAVGHAHDPAVTESV